MSQNTGSKIPHVLPVGREWIISMCEKHQHITAYDAETLEQLFSGRYFAPKAYRRRDPRRWNSRQLHKLMDQYGLYGGSRYDGSIFVLAEVATLHALMQSVAEHDAAELRRMPLADALTEARDAYSSLMIEQAKRMKNSQ